MVKEVPAVRAEMVRPPTSVATVELHVTPNFVLSVSSDWTKISLLAVTAVVLTTIELETALVGSVTLPVALAPHTAGDAELLQLLKNRDDQALLEAPSAIEVPGKMDVAFA